MSRCHVRAMVKEAGAQETRVGGVFGGVGGMKVLPGRNQSSRRFAGWHEDLRKWTEWNLALLF